MNKDKSMNKEEAYKQWSWMSESNDPRVSMIRDSWQGGYTVQYTLRGTCVVSRTVSGDVATYAGRWF